MDPLSALWPANDPGFVGALGALAAFHLKDKRAGQRGKRLEGLLLVARLTTVERFQKDVVSHSARINPHPAHRPWHVFIY